MPHIDLASDSSRREFLLTSGVFAAGALMTAWFWVPAFLLRDSVHTHRLLAGYNHYSWHFVGVDQLIHAPWEAGILQPAGADHLPQFLGLHLWGAWLLVLLLAEGPT